jgi:hypothetical protein
MHFFNFLSTGVFGLVGLVLERRSISALFSTLQPQE